MYPYGTPGFSTLDETAERQILWGSDMAKGIALYRSAIISGAARDAGNTPTTVLRPGLVLGRVSATGEYEEWDAAAADGTQDVAAILTEEVRAQDFNANNVDRSWRVLVRGPVKAAQLLIQGSLFTTHVDEHLARRQLVGAGFIFDDDPFGYLAGEGGRVAAKTADYTVTDADNGVLFTNGGAAGAVNFTLPATAKRGLRYRFFVAADQNVTVTAGTADTLIVYNDIAADSIALSTASNKVGGSFEVIGDGSKWMVIFSPGQTSDGTATGQRVTLAT